jgi:hypothetical protein
MCLYQHANGGCLTLKKYNKGVPFCYNLQMTFQKLIYLPTQFLHSPFYQQHYGVDFHPSTADFQTVARRKRTLRHYIGTTEQKYHTCVQLLKGKTQCSCIVSKVTQKVLADRSEGKYPSTLGPRTSTSRFHSPSAFIHSATNNWKFQLQKQLFWSLCWK